MLTPEQKKSHFHELLLKWYKNKGRDHLPWRKTSDPYHILVSEIMLQQTQVDRVLPKYLLFLETFPTLEALAKGSVADVLRLWSGLGYNSRALRLKKVAEVVVEKFAGKMPQDREQLRALPGIGNYTSGAVMAFAFHAPVSFVDTNIKRILHRIFVGPEFQGWKRSDKEMEHLAEEVCPLDASYAYHQALMDLGSSLCRAAQVQCEQCPMAPICNTAVEIKFHPELVSEKRVSYKKSTVPFKQSKRFIRGGIVKYLRHDLEHKGVSFSELLDYVSTELRPMVETELLEILGALVAEGLVSVKGGRYYLGS